MVIILGVPILRNLRVAVGLNIMELLKLQEMV